MHFHKPSATLTGGGINIFFMQQRRFSIFYLRRVTQLPVIFQGVGMIDIKNTVCFGKLFGER